jgi:hypothetical protein
MLTAFLNSSADDPAALSELWRISASGSPLLTLSPIFL